MHARLRDSRTRRDPFSIRLLTRLRKGASAAPSNLYIFLLFAGLLEVAGPGFEPGALWFSVMYSTADSPNNYVPCSPADLLSLPRAGPRIARERLPVVSPHIGIRSVSRCILTP